MKIYIVEDDDAVISMLEDIVESENLGELCGSSTDGHTDSTDILAKAPDLILTDLLMSEKDGIQLMRELKAAGCQAKFIIISQVSSKEMIARAYSTGVDFYVYKPINRIEVCQVIRNAEKQIDNERALAAIRSVFAAQGAPAQAPREVELRRHLRYLLSQLGMSGEKGAQDVIEACCYIRAHGGSASCSGVRALCAALCPDAPKSMEQRMRRAMERSLRHLASLGLEDYTNEVFVRYATHLFPFEEVRREMAAIQRRGEGGHVSVKTFLDGLMVLLDE